MLLELEDVTRATTAGSRRCTASRLDVDEGEIVALIGANGAGKTTTMRAISGLRPSPGRSRSTARTSPGCAAHLRVVARHLPGARGPGHLPRHDGAGEPGHGRLHPARPASIAADLDRVFGLFPRLAERRKQVGGTLSGGEQQMLAIGRALMAGPGCCCWTSRRWAWPRC